MPGHDDLRQRLILKAKGLDSGEHANNLAQMLSDRFSDYAPMDTGTLSKNLQVVFPASRTGEGIWTAGVGDRSKVGDQNAPAPRGTISEFLIKVGGPDYGFWPKTQKNVPRHYAWWALPKYLKDRLQQERMKGRFGGESGVGIGRSPYVYSQNRGNAGAGIIGSHFYDMAIMAWKRLVGLYVKGVS